MKHLEENSTTYWKHLGFALMLSLKLLILSMVGVIHAIIPYIFQNTVTSGVKDIDNLFEEDIGNYGGTK
tara:strand:- start:499 stop:705 length:207 start_codon:yes stop_codon:yes gene_type:complete